MVRLPAPAPPSRRRVRVSLQREIYSYSLDSGELLVPCHRVTRCLAATEAAEVTEEEERRTGVQAGGPKKKELCTSPLPSSLPPSLIHPISHTFLSHLAEYAEDCHLSVRRPVPLSARSWPTIRS